MMEPVDHLPVLYNEIIPFLQPHDTGRYVDCTLGAGSHAKGILAASHPQGQLLALDVDNSALEIARNKLESFQDRVFLVHSSFKYLSNELDALGWQMVDGILLDLGLSSMQLDVPERGFSFRREASLDMRFNQQDPMSAMDLVNNLSEGELAAEEQACEPPPQWLFSCSPCCKKLSDTYQAKQGLYGSKPRNTPPARNEHSASPAW